MNWYETATPFEKGEGLLLLLTGYATGHGAEDSDYRKLRGYFVADPILREKLPSFVRICRDLSQFWEFIKSKYATYAERRLFLRSEFEPLLNYLEGTHTAALEDDVTTVLTKVDSVHVQEAWRKSLERRTDDLGGAITTSRTLIEAVCKYVLDQHRVMYSKDEDLPKLYWLAAAQLKLAPSQHTYELIKRILGAAQQIVEGVGGLRNEFGDAHGKGTDADPAEPRFATLAVNLAGSLATFLIESFEAAKSEKTANATPASL